MSLENIFVIAAATGRTLVLPPPQHIYLLQNANNVDEFFPIHTPAFRKRVEVITSQEFVTKVVKGGYLDPDHLPKVRTPSTPSFAQLLLISKGCHQMKNGEGCRGAD